MFYVFSFLFLLSHPLSQANRASVSPEFDAAFASVGGAIFAFARNDSTLGIIDCYFSRNEAYGGGAVAAFGKVAVDIQGTTFYQNAALVEPNRRDTENFQGLGGGVLADDGFSGAEVDLSISGCTFDNNVAFIAGGAIEYSPPNSLSISQSVFINNIAVDLGGALASFRSNVQISMSLFNGNSAGYAGGAIVYGQDATGAIFNSTFGINRNNANEIDGRPPSPDIYRMEELTGPEIADIDCGNISNVFCNAVGFPEFVSTNYNNLTCSNSTTGGCPESITDPISTDGFLHVSVASASSGNADSWTWPRIIY